MIEKLECTCIEAYTVRKMRDPNCCACSCDHNDLVEQLAKANERIEELQDALVDDSKAKAMLNKLVMENGELNIKASGNIFHVFCSTFVETFKESGATNYLVAEFNSEELGAFTVTMQRSEGLTVYQKLNEANERVKALESVVAAAIHAFDAYEMDVDTYPTIEHVMLKNNLQSHLNKFAIENQAKGAEALIYAFPLNASDQMKEWVEQLRKEGE